MRIIMPITFYRVFIRPSTSVKFLEDSPDFTQYVLNKYVANKDCIEFRTTTYSEDNTIKTVKSVWANQDAFEKALSDPAWQTNIDILNLHALQNDIIINTWVE